MNKNYIIISFPEGSVIPHIEMEYSDIEYFKKLIFLLVSDVGTELLIKVLQEEFSKIDNNQEEINTLKTFTDIIQLRNKSTSQDIDSPLMKPSSFK